MKWLWITLCLAALAGGGYYYYGYARKSASVSHEIRETKATLLSKQRDHQALWVHYKYQDAQGHEHEMSEKVPYIDLWESYRVGQLLDIYYNGEGLAALKLPGRTLQ